MHPTAECRKGNHVSTEIRDGVTRCIWCGLIQRTRRDIDATPTHVPAHDASAPSCCGSTTRQVNYPRPTITERHDDVANDFDERFTRMAREYVASSAALRHWQSSGNKLPKVYE